MVRAKKKDERCIKVKVVNKKTKLGDKYLGNIVSDGEYFYRVVKYDDKFDLEKCSVNLKDLFEDDSLDVVINKVSDEIDLGNRKITMKIARDKLYICVRGEGSKVPSSIARVRRVQFHKVIRV